MALGASRLAVWTAVIREALWVAMIGLAAGLAAALALTRLIRGWLYEIEPNDPATLAAIVFLLGMVTLFASAGPAWYATRVDPAVALRSE
jgi:ABC-type antimicrobial peptide transport system permease subunit